MRVAKWGFGVGALVLLFVAGCTLPDYLGLNVVQQSGPGGERVVAGSLESVSQSTQATLRRFGMSAVATPEGEAVRIKSRTATGQNFALVLTRVKTDQGESTRVRIEWEGHADEAAGVQILGMLESQPR